MSSHDKPALQSLLSPPSVDEFLSDYWPDKALYFAVDGDPARLPEFLHAKELSSFDSLAHINQRPVAFGNGPKSARMVASDARNASNLYQMGLTVYFDNITRIIPGAKKFARQLARELGINETAARVSAWASPVENGAAPHYDPTDVFSIQLRGTKLFELARVDEVSAPYGKQYTPGASRLTEETLAQMVNGFPDWHDVEFEKVEMKPGSVLFFPRGTWHRTYASADSFAVSIMIEPPTAAECILDQLRLLMLQDPEWRRPLYGAWGNGQEREAAFEQAAKLVKKIPRIASAISAKDVVLATISLEKRLAHIDSSSRFQRMPNAGVILERQDGSESNTTQRMRITLRDEHNIEHTLMNIEIPAQHVDVVNWLATRDTPFRTRDLQAQFPEIASSEIKQLLGNCARCELLTMLWFPSIDGSN